MACTCVNVGCECVLVGGSGISVSGSGTSGDPFRVDNTRTQLGVDDTPSLDLTVSGGVLTGQARIGPLLSVQDTPTLNLTLGGVGTEASPLVLSGDVQGITNLDEGSTGDVLTKQIDGTWAPGPATQAPAGTVVVGDGLAGDGSGGDPLRVQPGTYADWEGLVF